METVKLVIEIPEEDYKRGTVMASAIRNGTILPKGHGRLIDADALDVGQVVDECGYRCGYKYIMKYELDNAPTIIEADRSEK